LRHLFVTNDFPPKLGGIESYLINLAKGFDPADIAVLAPARDGHEAVDATLPYEVVRLPGSYLRASRSVFRGLTEATRALDVDVVHFLAALPLGRLGSSLRDQTGVPFTVVAHGTGDVLLPARLPFARHALRRTLISADIVFTNSEFTRAAVAKITKDGARTSMLYPCVDVRRFSLDVSGARVRARIPAAGRFVVLFCGRMVKRKGADVLLRAIASVDGVFGVFVGEGPERSSLTKLARDLGIEDRTMFVGLVPDEELPQYYAAADAFCMPCSDRLGGLDTEGFGVVYLEAQASGLPCIAGRCGGSAEAVEDRVTGFVLDEPKPEDVAPLLAELARDPGLCAQLGGAGRARMEADFAPDVAAQRLEEAVEAAIG
jgi:phosphatidylinositol alpha-1,6-mannosyltransferase